MLADGSLDPAVVGGNTYVAGSSKQGDSSDMILARLAG